MLAQVVLRQGRVVRAEEDDDESRDGVAAAAIADVRQELEHPPAVVARVPAAAHVDAPLVAVGYHGPEAALGEAVLCDAVTEEHEPRGRTCLAAAPQHERGQCGAQQCSPSQECDIPLRAWHRERMEADDTFEVIN